MEVVRCFSHTHTYLVLTRYLISHMWNVVIGRKCVKCGVLESRMWNDLRRSVSVFYKTQSVTCRNVV